ncbi:MAG: hypothetical protein C5B51_01465 [Terriglobia bacterium]|nr:MAG: hypothetical protein C5B51_01465 [Terriglobia bacterium]
MRFQNYLLCSALLGLPMAATAQTTADLFDASILHEIRITMPAANWQGLKDHYLDDTNFNVDSFQWKSGSNTVTVKNLAIHSRGHGSRSPFKPALHVGFDKNVKGQTLLGLSVLVLKSNTEDPSMVHERLSMLLFQRMGLPAPRESPARFYVNDEYVGLYSIVENIDQSFLKRVFNETNGYLYQYRPGDWTGVLNAGYHFEYLGQDLTKYAVTPPDNKPAPFEPQTHSNSPDTVTLEGMVRTMNQASDADFVSAMTPYLDLKLFLTHIAVENYLADFDSILGDVFGMNNFQFYRFENKKLSQLIAWDKDNSFDSNVRPILENADVNVLMRRLVAIPEYKNAYLEALLKCAMLAGGAGGWLEQEALREYNQIKDAAYQDPNKGNGGGTKLATNDDFEKISAYAQGFAAIRTPFVINAILAEGYQAPGGYPTVAEGGVLSAAAVAPAAAGGVASVYGSNFGSADNTAIYFNGYRASILFASSGQLNVQVPWEAAGNSITVGAMVNGKPSNVTTAIVNAYSPGVFATFHSDGRTVVTTDNPAAASEAVTIYGTGLGPVTGGMVTGQPASTTSLQHTTTDPVVTVGNARASLIFSGLTPGFLGIYQINAQLPGSVPSGSQTPLAITIGGQTSFSVLPTR